jgi:endoglucanase
MGVAGKSSKGDWVFGSCTRRKILAAVFVALNLTAAAACSGHSSDPGSQTVRRQSSAPYWVNPDGNAARQVARYRHSDRAGDARLLERIASRPSAEWIGPDDPEGQARGFTEAAAKVRRSALLVVYDLPHRDCGQYSRGGAADGDAYRAWLDRVVAGIGSRKATVVVEPDALPHLLQEGCVPGQFREERFALLAEGVRKLKSLPGTRVYIDAGNPGFGSDPGAMADSLKRAGIAQADGFSVNVSNFATTAASTAYGKQLSKLTGGKHFVIDTSRNGNGPWHGGGEAWCNPPGRALGEAPTTRTGDPLVDAYLWVKRPGESDGTCQGGPPAGTWWPEYALELAKNAE